MTQPDPKFKLLGSADDVVGVVANYVQVISVIIPVGTVYGLLKGLWNGGLDQSDPTLQAISDAVSTVLRAQAGSDFRTEMFNINSELSVSERRYRTLMEFGPSDPQVSLAETIQDTGAAVSAISGKTYWFRQYFPQLTYADQAPDQSIWWVSVNDRADVQPDVDDQSFPGYPQVFDHRLPLPAYCVALALFHASVTLLRPTDYANPTFVADSLTDLGVLVGYHAKARDGIHLVRIPTQQEVEEDPEPFYHTPTPFSWIYQYPYGAVDVYSNIATLRAYPSGYGDYTSHPITPFSVYVYNPPLNTYQLLITHLDFGRHQIRKDMYLTAGLHFAWSIVQHLRTVLDPGAVEFADPAASWSLREIAATLGTAFSDPSQPPPLVQITAADLITRMLRFVGEQPGPSRLSLRAGLRAATGA